MNLTTTALLDLSHTLAGDDLARFQYPWEAPDSVKTLILTLGPRRSMGSIPPASGSTKPPPPPPRRSWARPASSAGVRHCAFIRDSALVGGGCVVGNSVELKSVILFSGVQTPHYSYVGDPILGFKNHMGAGSITSSVKSGKTLVTVRNGEERLETGWKKFGAILGDHVEADCNSVLNPGPILGRNASVYPLSSVRGAVPPDSIFKEALI